MPGGASPRPEPGVGIAGRGAGGDRGGGMLTRLGAGVIGSPKLTSSRNLTVAVATRPSRSYLSLALTDVFRVAQGSRSDRVAARP